ncbi:cytosolic phospholipase A2 gamma-like [Micropterus salmoides]|uniref:cytosolic phospholipase A2 gamma-like n=1 Tax=Micropterus salmoides TaxID=27706 RepID=UPI0018EE3EA1|nr:cytosolic phospholipase A2 gamma-like [Micropterus salmoides]
MLCGKASWIAGLLYACIVMLGPMGQPVDNSEDMSSVTPQMEAGSSEELTPAPAANTEKNSIFAPKQYVRQTQSLSAREQEFVLKRKQVALKSLNRQGISCTLESVPHIALIGSGGGQRAAVGLMGSLYQLEKEGLLDTLLYLGGVSGSTWSMSLLYSDPQWSTNMDRAVSRLSGTGVDLVEALAWLDERAKKEDFSLSDIWGLMTSVGIMKQFDPRSLSEDGINAWNPYPIFNAVNKNCLYDGPEKSKWFEMTPHEAGFTDLGLFINTSLLGSRIHEADAEGGGSTMDMVRLQGIEGSAFADEYGLLNYMTGLLKVPQQVRRFWYVLEYYMRGYRSLLKLTELIRRNTEDPAVLSGLDNLQKTLKEKLNLNPIALLGKKSPEQQKQIIEQWFQKKLASLKTLEQSLDEGPIKDNVSLMIQKVFTLIVKWEWGTTKNLLYQYPDAAVPSCITLKENLQLIDAVVMLNVPYPPFLGDKRDVDLIIAPDYGGDDTFKTLTLARDYAAAVKKPFPEIDDKILEERDWPKDCYVFEGKGKEPSIIYMPLFNRKNCKDAEEFKAKTEEFSTFHLPFSQEKTESLLEIAKANIKNNKETLLREINKAVLRRRSKRSSAESDF